MKILITGSAGFLLGNFIRKAIYDQNQKKPQDRHSFSSIDKINSNALNSMYWNKNHTFYIADIRDPHIINVIFQFEQPDIVIHGAAETSSSNDFLSCNVLGTQSIIDACVKHKTKKLIYISTDQVYGDHKDVETTTEDRLPNPRNLYASSKAAGEMLIKAAFETNNLNYNIVRVSNVFGPRQSMDKLIPKTIKSINDNTPIIIYDQGLQTREWTYVADICSGLMTIVEKGQNNEIYNLSANYEFSNLEVVQHVCNAMKTGHNLITFTDDPIKNRDFNLTTNTLKIKNLGWSPSYKFKEALQESLDWFNSNKWFIK
jgi:dTDP-glucose 4,6-dehydratase